MEEEDCRNYYAKLEENHNAPLLTQFIGTLNLYRQVCEYADKQKHQGMFDMNSSAVTAYIDTNFRRSGIMSGFRGNAFQIK